MKIEQQVRSLKNRLGLRRAGAKIASGRSGAIIRLWAVIQDGLSAQPEPSHSIEKRTKPLPIRLRISAAAEALQPINFATHLLQPLHVLHVNPEMPAALGKVGHVEG